MDALTSERIGSSNASLIVRLLVLAHRLDVEISAVLAHSCQTVPRALALFMLQHHEHVALGGVNLARLLALSAASIGKLLHAFESEGLIDVAQDPNDKRVREVHLTDAGRSAAKYTTMILEERGTHVLRPLDAEKREQLRWELDIIDQYSREVDARRLSRFYSLNRHPTSRYC